MTPPAGQQLFLIDTSALARLREPAVRLVVTGLLADAKAATCVTVDLEAGYSARSALEVRRTHERRRELYEVLPINEAIADRARAVQSRMAASGHHRAAGIVDLLTAAVAEHHGAILLHYDNDFEHIARSTSQPQRWIVPRGTID